LRVLLAGTHQAGRRFTVHGEEFALAPAPGVAGDGPVSWKRLDGGVGWLRIENSLGDSAAVSAFDEALAQLHDAEALILDLRNVPSGGDTRVAEPMLGRFVTAKSGYQRVLVPSPKRTFPADSWVKSVRPRGPAVTAKLVVLVDHWTASMGEGMAIGLDALQRAVVVGTRMAGLCGGTGSFVLPDTGIGVHFPVERLYHVDGTPREKWVPPVLVDLAAESGDDPILARGLAALA
jgi:C-terminal processing protease CtpA/Prc